MILTVLGGTNVQFLNPLTTIRGQFIVAPLPGGPTTVTITAFHMVVDPLAGFELLFNPNAALFLGSQLDVLGQVKVFNGAAFLVTGITPGTRRTRSAIERTA